MKGDLITYLLRFKGRRLATVFTLAILGSVGLGLAGLDLLLNGKVTAGYLLTGLVAAGLVTAPCLALLGYLLGELGERQQTSLAYGLIHAESRLKMALEAAGLLVWELEVASDTLRYDDSMLSLVGMSAKGAPHSLANWLERVHPDDRDMFVERFQTSLRAGAPVVDLDYRLGHEAEQTVWVHTHGVVARRGSAGQTELVVGTTMNITARKQIELGLQRAQSMAHIGSWELDPVRNQLAGSAETHRIFGLVPGQSLGFADILAATHPDDRALVDAAWQAAWRGAPYDITHRIVVDGQVKWVRQEAVLNFDADGRLSSGAGTVQDVMRQVLVEQELMESENRFRQIFDAVSDAIFIHDPETGRIVDVNRGMCRLYGCTREEAIGLGLDAWSADMPAYSSVEAAVRIRQALEAEPQVFEWRARRRDGHLFWAEVTLRAARVGGQRRVLAVVRNIDARKRVEADLEQHRRGLEFHVDGSPVELTEAQARASRILESAADGLYGIDQNGIVFFVNPVACRILGYDAEEIVGYSAHALFHHSRLDGSPYPAEECPSHDALKRNMEVRVDDEVYWHADGHAIPVMYSVHPIVRSGRFSGAVTRFVDIGGQGTAARSA